MANGNFFSIDTDGGHSLPGTYDRLVRAKNAAAIASKKSGRLTISERKSDWSFVAMRGIASNGEYIRIER